jgi:RNA polymerase sigma factor (sigma-70 family)
MVRLAEGDRAAYPELLRELWPVLRAFVQRGVRHEQDAEDVAQEVFLRICSRISDFDCTRDGLSWAFGIASYQIMTHRRRQQRRRESFSHAQLDRQLDDGPTLDALLIQRELTSALTQTIGELSAGDHAALGLLTSDSAREVQDPAQRKRRQRAMVRLRDLWRKIHGEP